MSEIQPGSFQARPMRTMMNNGEQVTETGQTALQLPVMLHRPAGTRKTRPYKDDMLVKGVVEVTLNDKPAGQTLFTRIR